MALDYILLYYTGIHCTILRWTALDYVLLYYTIIHCSTLYNPRLYCTKLNCTALNCTVLYCTELHCTRLYCIEEFKHLYVPNGVVWIIGELVDHKLWAVEQSGRRTSYLTQTKGNTIKQIVCLKKSNQLVGCSFIYNCLFHKNIYFFLL